MSRIRILVAIGLLGWAAPSRPEAPALQVSWMADGAVTGAAFVALGASELAKGSLAPLSCRWCGADQLDTRVRNAVVWSNKKMAATGSDVLQVAVPLGVAGYDLLAARGFGGLRRASEDILVVAEAVAISGALTQVGKYGAARIRPYAYFGQRDVIRDDHLSFWSGHTVVTFSAAAAGGTVARMRGYAGWPGVYAVGFVGAALTGYLRMASDKHWLTDILASAAVGTGVGVLVPWMNRPGPKSVRYQVIPTPGGVAIAGEF